MKKNNMYYVILAAMVVMISVLGARALDGEDVGELISKANDAKVSELLSDDKDDRRRLRIRGRPALYDEDEGTGSEYGQDWLTPPESWHEQGWGRWGSQGTGPDSDSDSDSGGKAGWGSGWDGGWDPWPPDGGRDPWSPDGGQGSGGDGLGKEFRKPTHIPSERNAPSPPRGFKSGTTKGVRAGFFWTPQFYCTCFHPQGYWCWCI
eukprot:14319_1